MKIARRDQLPYHNERHQDVQDVLDFHKYIIRRSLTSTRPPTPSWRLSTSQRSCAWRALTPASARPSWTRCACRQLVQSVSEAMMCVPKLPTLCMGDAWHCKAFVDEKFGTCLGSLYQRPDFMNKEKGPDSFVRQRECSKKGTQAPCLEPLQKRLKQVGVSDAPQPLLGVTNPKASPLSAWRASAGAN